MPLDIPKTATELLAIAEACDVISTRPMSEPGKEFWRRKRDFLRGLADVLDELPEAAEITAENLQLAAEKAVA